MRDFQRTDDRVDAIVLDAVTPAENGASLARHAKDFRLPVVMISGSHDIMSFAAVTRRVLMRSQEEGTIFWCAFRAGYRHDRECGRS